MNDAELEKTTGQCYKCGDLSPLPRIKIEIDPKTGKHIKLCASCFFDERRQK
jgi:hypothetical protein